MKNFSISKKKWYVRIPRPKISLHTKFQLFLTSFDTKVTICHFLWIFNEAFVNFKYKCHNWIARPKIPLATHFHPSLALFDYFIASNVVQWHHLTACHFSWIFDEDGISMVIKWLKWHARTLNNTCVKF